MLDRLLLFLPDLHLFILHYYMNRSTSSNGVSHNASISLLRDAMLHTLLLLSRALILVKFPQIIHTFLCYYLDRFCRWCISDLFLTPPQTHTHFVKSMFSRFRSYKPQAEKPTVAEHIRAYFFTVPS